MRSGIIITLIMGIFLLMIFVIHVGLSAGPCMDPFLEEEKKDANKLVSRTPGGLAKKVFVFFFVFFPVVSLIFAVVMGGILAAAEG